MNNLHFAIIASYNCVKHLNELEELTEEQRDLLFEFECKAWSEVTEDDMQEFNFKFFCWKLKITIHTYIYVYKNIFRAKN